MRNFITLITLTFILTSCAVRHHHVYGPDTMRSRSFIELGLNDIEYLGETEISYEYSRYLFVGKRLIGINGEQPDNSEKHYVRLPFTPWQQFGSLFDFTSKFMSRALYKVFTDYPDADYIEVTSTNIETHSMFLGRKVKETSIVKAYKYRYLSN